MQSTDNAQSTSNTPSTSNVPSTMTKENSEWLGTYLKNKAQFGLPSSISNQPSPTIFRANAQAKPAFKALPLSLKNASQSQPNSVGLTEVLEPGHHDDGEAATSEDAQSFDAQSAALKAAAVLEVAAEPTPSSVPVRWSLFGLSKGTGRRGADAVSDKFHDLLETGDRAKSFYFAGEDLGKAAAVIQAAHGMDHASENAELSQVKVQPQAASGMCREINMVHNLPTVIDQPTDVLAPSIARKFGYPVIGLLAVSWLVIQFSVLQFLSGS